MQRVDQGKRLTRLRRGTAEINVVPFVDVLLVLLVVFMVGAPLATQGVTVQLPTTRPANLSVGAASPLVVTVTADGTYSISTAGEEELAVRDLAQIGRHIRVLVRRGTAPVVVVRADARADYSLVAQLLTEVRAAGVGNVGLITRVRAAAP